MRRKIFLAIAAAVTVAAAGVPAASAQGTAGYWFGGLLVERERVNPMDIFSLTQTQFNYGTARSMAMAGAFTSLGADLSSMTLNPAGLGMYRHSELSLTPLVSTQRSTNSAQANASNSSTRFSVGSLGFVIKAYEGTGSVLSVNLGFGYNRLADYNYDYSFRQYGNSNTSLAGVLAYQLNASRGGIGVNNNGRIADSYGNSDFDLSSELWGGVLGYKCGLLNYYPGYGWGLDEYADPFYTNQYTSVESRGSAGEYTLSMGMNFGNKLYFGAALGIMSIRQRRTITYSEEVEADGAVDTNVFPYLLEYFDYAQWMRMSGTGINLKLGLTWRPVESLRVGVAFHTPTYCSMDFSYAAGMNSASRSVGTNPDGYDVDRNGMIYSSESTPRIDDNGPDTWEMASPARLLAGVSYAFGSFAVVSFDYERDWYNGIRMKHMPYGFDKAYYDDYFRTAFKGSNTFRAGLELKPTQRLALRAGYGHSGSMLRSGADEDLVYMTPVVCKTDMWSVGLGYALSRRVSLDVAYQNVSSRTTDYSLFYAMAYDDAGMIDWGDSYSSDLFSTRFSRHNVAMTLTVKF